jgi:hypothetical protein
MARAWERPLSPADRIPAQPENIDAKAKTQASAAKSNVDVAGARGNGPMLGLGCCMLGEESGSVPDDYIIPLIYESRSGAKAPSRIIFANVAGGIGDFTVATVKDGAEGQARAASAASIGKTARIPGRGNSHYILLLNQGWEQDGPLKFHNGYLDELRGRFRLAAKVTLPEMPAFFPAGAEGEMVFQGKDVLHLESALRGQSLFAHLEGLRDLVQRVADRKLAFPDFLAGLNRLSLPVAWRNEIVNGLFSHAESAPAATAPKPPGLSGDLDKLMGLLNQESAGGSKLSPSLSGFLDEVGRDSTGFTLRDGAARQLHADLERTLASLRGSLLSHAGLASVLGLLSSLQRLARLAKGRERQTVHLWSGLPSDPESLLVGDQANPEGDHAVALVLLDAPSRDAGFLRGAAALAGRLGCPLLLQSPEDAIPAGEAMQAWSESAPKAGTYFFSGGVASRVEGDNCVFRPAALAFLEGLVGSRENVDYYIHRALVLEDQDLITRNGQACATDQLLDNARWDAVIRKGVNRVNGARNKSQALFPLLKSWADT